MRCGFNSADRCITKEFVHLPGLGSWTGIWHIGRSLGHSLRRNRDREPRQHVDWRRKHRRDRRRRSARRSARTRLHPRHRRGGPASQAARGRRHDQSASRPLQAAQSFPRHWWRAWRFGYPKRCRRRRFHRHCVVIASIAIASSATLGVARSAVAPACAWQRHPSPAVR